MILFLGLGSLAPYLNDIAGLAAFLLCLAGLLRFSSACSVRGILAYLIFCCAGFGAGLLAALWSTAPPAELPDWVAPSAAQRVSAVVEQVEARPGEKIQIILSEVRPVAAGKEPLQGPPLSAGLVWTWVKPEQEIPLPGQGIAVDLQIREIRPEGNPGTFDLKAYWQGRGVGFRAFTYGDKGAFTSISPAPFWQKARDWLQARMLTALFAGQRRAEAGPDTGSAAVLSSGKAIIPALLTGNKYYLTQQQLDLFAAASLSHSLALSGLHLGLMTGIGALLAFGICRLWPQLMLTVPRAKLAVLCAVLPVLFYLWLGGLTPSLLRAALMFACMGWMLWRGRAYVLLDGLLWALLFMLLLNPTCLHDLRLQLSAACIAAIGLVFPYTLPLAARLFPGGQRRWHYLRAGFRLLLISLAIQLVLLPLQVSAFGQITPWFILNLLWLPLLSVVVFPLSLLGLFLSLIPGLGTAAAEVFNLAALPADALFALLEWLQQADLLSAPAALRPLPQASLAYWLLVFLLAALGSRLSARAACLATQKTTELRQVQNGLCSWLKKQWSRNLSASPHMPRLNPLLPLLLFSAWLLMGYCLWERHQAEYPAGPRLTLFELSQGQAVLFEGTEGQRILVSSGLRRKAFDVGRHILAPALTLNRPPYLTALINTHPDWEQSRGLLYLFQKFQIGRLCIGQDLAQKNGDALAHILEKRALSGENIPLQAGESLPLDKGHSLLAVYPAPEEREKETAGNAAKRSLVLQLMAGEKGLALLCGDLKKSGIKKLLQLNHAPPPQRHGEACASCEAPTHSLHSEVLILPRHGSKQSLVPALYTAVSPELALVSAGAGNRWGFPAQAVREELARLGIPLYSSSEYGQIQIQWDGQGEKALSFARLPAP